MPNERLTLSITADLKQRVQSTAHELRQDLSPTACTLIEKGLAAARASLALDQQRQAAAAEIDALRNQLSQACSRLKAQADREAGMKAEHAAIVRSLEDARDDALVSSRQIRERLVLSRAENARFIALNEELHDRVPREQLASAAASARLEGMKYGALMASAGLTLLLLLAPRDNFVAIGAARLAMGPLVSRQEAADRLRGANIDAPQLAVDVTPRQR